MSRIDDIEALLSNPTQKSDERGMAGVTDAECWRCGMPIEPCELGACDACVVDLRSERPVEDDSVVVLPASRVDLRGLSRLDVDSLVERIRFFDEAVQRAARQVIAQHLVASVWCVNGEDLCSSEYPCQQCPRASLVGAFPDHVDSGHVEVTPWVPHDVQAMERMRWYRRWFRETFGRDR